jgi:ABC-2 type transport system permease protein
MSLTALLGVTMGMFFSTLAKNEFQVIQFVPIVVVPQALLSGILFEISAIPEWLRHYRMLGL